MKLIGFTGASNVRDMTPLKILKKASEILEQMECNYCLIGGHASSLYRSQERLTRDVDFALVAKPLSKSRLIAERVVSQLGLTPVIGFIPHTGKEKIRKAICLITSSPRPNEAKGIVDILLPVLPWVVEAVERAQHNRIDLGFAAIPVITPEDMIIAKCYALQNSPDRFQDLDDLKEIFQFVKELDLEYLRHKMSELELIVPQLVRQFCPL